MALVPDRESLKQFEEAYTPVESHKKAVVENAAKAEVISNAVYSELLSSKNLAYLSEKRIEINAIKSVVGNERLWEFIKYSLNLIFEDTDYNRAIDVFQIAKDVWPTEVLQFNTAIAEKKAKVLKEKRDAYWNKLDGYTMPEPEHTESNGYNLYGEEIGFIEVEKYESKMTDDFKEEIKKDEELKPTLRKIQKLTEKLKSGEGQ